MTALAALLGLALAVSLAISGDSLRKGQVTKQFTAYSISESLARHGFAPLASSVPCGSRGADASWVEEPPLFHEIAAAVLRVFPGSAAAVPVIAFLLCALGTYLIASRLEGVTSAAETGVIALAAAFNPAFVRYGVQHLPDFLATALLILGAAVLIGGRSRGREAAAFFLFIAATTTKALVAPAAAALLAWNRFGRARARARSGAIANAAVVALEAAALALPFVAWVLWVRARGVPSPFSFGHGILENRHSGDWAILLDLGYYRRLFSWVAIQGTGLVLFAGAAVWAVRGARARQWNEQNRMLLYWMASLLPFVLLVRRGNWLHDYYVLPFLAPFAIAGASEIVRSRLRGAGISLLLGTALLGLSIANGIWSGASMRAIPLAPGQARPIFCGAVTTGATPQ